MSRYYRSRFPSGEIEYLDLPSVVREAALERRANRAFIRDALLVIVPLVAATILSSYL